MVFWYQIFLWEQVEFFLVVGLCFSGYWVAFAGRGASGRGGGGGERERRERGGGEAAGSSGERASSGAGRQRARGTRDGGRSRRRTRETGDTAEGAGGGRGGASGSGPAGRPRAGRQRDPRGQHLTGCVSRVCVCVCAPLRRWETSLFFGFVIVIRLVVRSI